MRRFCRIDAVLTVGWPVEASTQAGHPPPMSNVPERACFRVSLAACVVHQVRDYRLHRLGRMDLHWFVGDRQGDAELGGQRANVAAGREHHLGAPDSRAGRQDFEAAGQRADRQHPRADQERGPVPPGRAREGWRGQQGVGLALTRAVPGGDDRR